MFEKISVIQITLNKNSIFKIFAFSLLLVKVLGNLLKIGVAHHIISHLTLRSLCVNFVVLEVCMSIDYLILWYNWRQSNVDSFFPINLEFCYSWFLDKDMSG